MSDIRVYTDIARVVPRLPHDKMMKQSKAICAAVDERRGTEPKPPTKHRKRRLAITQEQVTRILALFNEGETYYGIGRHVGVHHETARRVVAAHYTGGIGNAVQDNCPGR